MTKAELHKKKKIIFTSKLLKKPVSSSFGRGICEVLKFVHVGK